jgi:hypothetical protein
MMLLVLMLAGHPPLRVDRELMPRGWGPGRTRGKMTELLLSDQVSFPARVALACCVPVHPCLRDSPRHPHSGPAVYDARGGGLGLNNESRGSVESHGSSRANFPHPAFRRAVQEHSCQTTLPGFDRRAAI